MKTKVLMIFLLLSWTMSAQDKDAMKCLMEYYTSLKAYTHQYTQEKVYLHLDNNAYFPGETIWFKAYVVGAASLMPVQLSKVLYVELLTPEGQVMVRRKCELINGRTSGELPLKDLLHSGYYEVRAYTRAMLNWDVSCIFSRVIPVFDAPESPLKYGPLKLFHPEGKTDKAWSRTTSESGRDLSCGSLSFYPEGGYITRGLSSRVAFRWIGDHGQPMEGKLRLYSASGTMLEETQVIHEGMGLFHLPASESSGAYVETIPSTGKTERYELPACREAGCDVSTCVDTLGNLQMEVSANAALGSQLLGMSVTCRGELCYFDTLAMTPERKVLREVRRRQLHEGVHQVTLFTIEGEILSERMVWIPLREKPMKLVVSQNAFAYQPFSPVALKFRLTDGEGHPCQGEFSLSVRDASGELVEDKEADIATDFLLSSDIKGYVHHPRYYFEDTCPDRLMHLDLLLMVQGWRRYSWKEMAGVVPFRFRQPVEEGLLVDGVVKDSRRKEAKRGLDVNLMIVQGRGFVSGTARTDEEGRFALMAPRFMDDAVGYFTTTLNDKRQSSNVALNYGFSPCPQPYDRYQLKAVIRPPRQQAQLSEQDIFQWTDTLPHMVLLPEAMVKEKSRLPRFGSRFSWMGGEETARNYASMYYNVSDAWEMRMAQGLGDMSLWDWLASVNPHLVVEMPVIQPPSSHENQPARPLRYDKEGIVEPVLYYRGRPVHVLLDNALPINDINYLMSDIRSLIVCETPDALLRMGVAKADFSSTKGVQPVTILLYSRTEQPLEQYRKGQHIMTLHGYSSCEDFYSPDYSRMDPPTREDVRRTLYWNPVVVTDKEGQADVLFFSNSRPDVRIKVQAQGMSVTGQLFRH